MDVAGVRRNLGDGHAWTHAPEHGPVDGPRRARACQRPRIDAFELRTAETLGSNADDDMRHVADEQRSADDVVACAEVAALKRFAEDGHRACRRGVFIRREESSAERTRAERREKCTHGLLDAALASAGALP